MEYQPCSISSSSLVLLIPFCTSLFQLVRKHFTFINHRCEPFAVLSVCDAGRFGGLWRPFSVLPPPLPSVSAACSCGEGREEPRQTPRGRFRGCGAANYLRTPLSRPSWRGPVSALSTSRFRSLPSSPPLSPLLPSLPVGIRFRWGVARGWFAGGPRPSVWLGVMAAGRLMETKRSSAVI